MLNPHRPASCTLLFCWFQFALFACFCRYYLSHCHFTSLHSTLLIWNWTVPNISRVMSFSLRTDSTENSLHCWDLFTKRLHSNSRGMDLQKTSHVIPCQQLHWWAGCCLATSNKYSFTETQFYCCVRVSRFLWLNSSWWSKYATIFLCLYKS
jgi:hypothetical protein